MGDIIHKKVKEVQVLCEDGSSFVVTGAGTIHINDNETKTEIKGRNIKTRSLSIGMRVDNEEHTNAQG